MCTASPTTYWFVFCSGSLLLYKEGDDYILPQSAQPPFEQKPWIHIQNLPPAPDGTPCKSFVINTPNHIEGTSFIGLRETYGKLPAWAFQMAGKAAELIYWDSNTKYCGVCGAPMNWQTDISKQCPNCGKEIWPQVSPAIIVRIRRYNPDRILLVHAKNFRRSEMYGLVAGFLETGETLEQCVEREVMEECHLRIKNLRYFGSQPWPFPCGVMVGFTADYDSGEIQIQEEELTNAEWFEHNNLPAIPDKMSIARQLIDDWIEHND